MIKYRAVDLKGNSVSDWQTVTPTIFPDKTVQVWKLGFIPMYSEVQWDYESDSELVQVAQLCDLLCQSGYVKNLNIPFFPYGRQDKEISDNSTFGLFSFVNLLSMIEVGRITTFDVHNPDPINANLGTRFVNTLPYCMVQIAQELKPDAIFFPDAGAAKRYGSMFKEMDTFHFNKVPHLCGEKVRDQATGEITGYSVGNVRGIKSVLVCDDLIDAGGTFIRAAKLLQEQGVEYVYLYASHGLFTKGTKILFDSGIKRIYTKDGEVKEIT